MFYGLNSFKCSVLTLTFVREKLTLQFEHLWLNRAGHVINSQETCLKHDPNIDALQLVY